MASHYTKTAIALHWTSMLFLIIAFSVGMYMVNLPLSPWKLKIYSWHKWIGVCIFFLIFIRLFWRLTHPTPTLPATMPLWEKRVAHITHAFLYFLMLTIPLSGWLFSSAAGFPVVLFGVLPLPDLVQKNEEIAAFFKQTHFLLNMTLLLLVILHISAALKHHFINKDSVLATMLPFLSREKSL